jgi:2-keto-3-deoxy-L-rhamnonate aldolase RhmA
MTRQADHLRALLRGAGMTMTWFTMGSVPLLELGSRQGCDAAVIDLQHGLWDRMSAHLAIGTVNCPVIARSADASVARIGEALDSGAAGILVPSIDNADQARAVVAAACYPELGARSGGGVRPLGEGFELYYRHHQHPLIGVMIETLEGVARVGEIARVSGVDFLFLGTGDLSLAIGCFPHVDDRLEQACRSVFDACRRANMPCGIFAGSAEQGRRRLVEGYRAVVIADDVNVVKAGFGGASRQMQSGS